MREINLDMDGTFVDLYGVENWLSDIRNQSVRPYEQAKPLVNLSALARVLNTKQKQGYKINVISWLAKTSTKEYDKAVTYAKRAWLLKHLPSVKFDKISIVAYGTPKSSCGQGVLFDDEEPNRNEWKGQAYGVENLVKQISNLA